MAVGTRSGDILLFDIAISSLVEKINAHAATIWSMHLSCDWYEMVTGGADKEVKFWKINEELREQHEHVSAFLVCNLALFISNYRPVPPQHLNSIMFVHSKCQRMCYVFDIVRMGGFWLAVERIGG